MNLQTATTVTGGLSSPSKMPCKSYGLPASRCISGSSLRRSKGTTCSHCYACKGRYASPATKAAQERRWSSTIDARWSIAMVTLIRKQSPDYFRWHDSGDLRSVDHLRDIIEICELTPRTRHWIPTREAGILRKYRQAGGRLPPNLTIRFSAIDLDDPLQVRWPYAASCVRTGPDLPGTYTCPAPEQDGNCRDCRACWDLSVRSVCYKLH